ncbi:MAG: helicase-associated domain-containing protein [Chloroflexota bacterium]|jgi:hypothetical protein
MKLREALEECTLSLLRKIVANHGAVAEETTLRGELVEQICHRLLEPGHLTSFLAGLTPQEKSLIQVMRSRNWVEKTFVLDRQFPSPKLVGSSGEQPMTSPRVTLAHKGIIYRSFGSLGNWRGEVYHIPEELRSPLAELLPVDSSPAKPRLESLPAPEAVIERDGPFDIFCLLSFIARGTRRLVRGSLGITEISRLERELGNQSLGSGDKRECRWRFLLHLALANGWLTRRGNSLYTTRNAMKLLAGTHDEIRSRLVEGYCRDQSWSDLAGPGKVKQALGSRRIDERAGRRLLLHHLEEFSEGRWVDEKAFIEALRATNPDFLREDYASPTWGIVDAITGGELYGPDSWDLVEGQWIKYVLYGPLCWLGALRHGTSPDGRTSIIQLAHKTDGNDASSNATCRDQSSIQISADLEVLAPACCDLALLFRLEPYMELVSRGKINRYRVTRASIHGALEAGKSRDELRTLLRSTGEVSVPDEAFRKIELWASEYGRYRLEQPLIVQTTSPEELDRLMDLPAVSKQLGARLGSNSIRIAPERFRQLHNAMKEAGLPLQIDAALRRQGLQRLTADVGILQESLFALKLIRELHGGVEFRGSENAIRRLEAVLDPAEAEDVSRRVKEAVKRLAERREGVGGVEKGRSEGGIQPR